MVWYANEQGRAVFPPPRSSGAYVVGKARLQFLVEEGLAPVGVMEIVRSQLAR